MKALPVTFTDPVTGIQDKESPSFFTTNIQLTRAFRRLELYAGSENLFDFRQPAPIINRDDPYSDRFDAANVWGPILGRRIYAGFRFKWL
jgi:outer membrane receptor protein involved in Fe transport